MSKRIAALFAGAALVASVLIAGPAAAQTSVPDVVQIDDPAGDANTTSGDQVTPAGNVSNVGDLRKIWFSNTADKVSVHIQTTLAPPASAGGLLYTILASPGEGPVGKQAAGCLQFRLFVPGANAGGTYQGKWWPKLHDRCNDGTNWINNGVEGEYVVEPLADGTGLTTMTFPRSYSSLLADGQSLAQPTGRSDALVGTDKVTIPATPATNPAHPWTGLRYDDTKVGADYSITGGGSSTDEPQEEPPGKSDPPGKGEKKGCPKGKGKKKGACPGKKPTPPAPPAGSCPAYVPGEKGAEAETTLVTDAATQEKPIEMEFTFGRAMGSYAPAPVDTSVHVLHNVQVDATGAEAGLWVRLETPVTDDPDLYAYWNTGKEAARAAGFNQALVAGPLPLGLLSGTGNGGHSGFGYEQIDGIRTPDCEGFTLDLVNWLGAGGTYKLKLWLGEIKNDPKPPGSEKRATTSIFDFLMSF